MAEPVAGLLNSNMELVDAGGENIARGQDSGVNVVMKASQFASDCYNMNHEKRGYAVIFNHKLFDPVTEMPERAGTDIDAVNMYRILTEMGFTVDIQHDLTAENLELYLKKVASYDHTDSDCFACVILSHGEEGLVYGKNGPIQIDKLVAPFKGNKCKSLAGKPKIFFIQACRGKKLDAGVEVPDAIGPKEEEEEMDVDRVEMRRIPTEADFLMAYSVVPGYFAWRNTRQGSWFIQALVKVLRENWKRMDLQKMLTRVAKKVAYEFESNANTAYMTGKKQIPCMTSMLTRDVYFTPKE